MTAHPRHSPLLLRCCQRRLWHLQLSWAVLWRQHVLTRLHKPLLRALSRDSAVRCHEVAVVCGWNVVAVVAVCRCGALTRGLSMCLRPWSHMLQVAAVGGKQSETAVDGGGSFAVHAAARTCTLFLARSVTHRFIPPPPKQHKHTLLTHHLYSHRPPEEEAAAGRVLL